MNKSVLAGIVMAAGLATSVMAQGPSATINTRWSVVGSIPADGATSITLVLQGQVTNLQNVPAPDLEGGTRVTGNYGINQVGFGPGNVSSKITATDGAATVSVVRGSWGGFTEKLGGVTRTVTGSTPNTGAYKNYGFRFFSSPSAKLFTTNENGNAGDSANGELSSPLPNDANNKKLDKIDLLRNAFTYGGPFDDTTGLPIGFNPLADGAFQDIYRVEIRSNQPLKLTGDVLGAKLDFNGFASALVGIQQAAGTQWGGIATEKYATSASISFYAVPTPGAAMVLGLGGLAAARRRR